MKLPIKISVHTNIPKLISMEGLYWTHSTNYFGNSKRAYQQKKI